MIFCVIQQIKRVTGYIFTQRQSLLKLFTKIELSNSFCSFSCRFENNTAENCAVGYHNTDHV